MVSETARQVPFLVWVRRSTAALLVLTFIPLMVELIRVSVIPTRYLAVALIVYGILVAAIVWMLLLLRKRTAHRWLWLLTAVSLLCSVVNVAGYVVVRAADDTLSGVQSGQVKYIDYVIIARKGDTVQVDSAASVGTAKSDPLFDRASKTLAQETPAAQRPYDTLTNMIEAVRTGKVVLASMRQASWQLVQDNYPEFYNQAVVLATYQVRADAQVVSQADVSKPFALYISGIDTYGEISSVSRSDVNMLAVVNPMTHQMLLVNTPRDYYVQLHGTSDMRDKLTHAGIYGVDMSRQTLEDLYGVSIPYYARINFTSLVKIIDTIGPIQVQSDYAFKSYKVGMNTLDSKQALEFARERYSFSEGDRQRGRNQQRVIEAIVAKMSRPENALYMNAILGAVSNSVETDLTEQSLKRLIRMQLDDMRKWTVESIAVDGSGSMQPTYSMGAQKLYVMIPNEQTLDVARQRIQATLEAK